MATQEIGIPTCTLGQIRHRADLIIYWACDPWSAHPRHLERYTSFTEGRFEKSEWKGYMQKVKAAAGKKKLDAASRRDTSSISLHLTLKPALWMDLLQRLGSKVAK